MQLFSLTCTISDAGKMKVDTNSFPIGMVELKHKKILVHMDQAETTKGKSVVVSDDLHNRMIKPHNPEIGMWKENMQRKLAKRVKPTLAMLIENISGSWRKTGGTGPPKGSNGTDSLRPGTDLICRRRGMVGSPSEGRRSTIQIRNPG
jgi:hypothetical protein